MKTVRNKKRINVLFITGLLLIAAALLLVVRNVLDEQRAARSAQEIFEKLEAASDQSGEENEKAKEAAAGEGKDVIRCTGVKS